MVAVNNIWAHSSSVLGGLLHVVDDNNVDGALLRFQLQSELLLQSFHECRPRWVGREVCSGRRGAIKLRRELKAEIKRPAQTGMIDHWPIHTGSRIRQRIDEQCNADVSGAGPKPARCACRQSKDSAARGIGRQLRARCG
jgi:hypothetical protein